MGKLSIKKKVINWLIVELYLYNIKKKENNYYIIMM